MSDEKKIIIDEDWKSQVAAEKEALAREHAAAHPPGEPASAGGSAPPPGAPPTPLPLPPASFEMLVTTLATEAMIGLGQLPHPMTGQVHAEPAQARYAIDMIEMLAEKTRGNLTPDEERGLGELLHQLRMAFLATQPATASPASD